MMKTDMNTLTRKTVGKVLLAGAATIGASAVAASITAAGKSRKQAEMASMFRDADEEVAAEADRRRVRTLSLMSVGTFLVAAVVSWSYIWVGWTLIGAAISMLGMSWHHMTGTRARLSWILTGLGFVIFIGSFIALLLTNWGSFSI
jgi:Flp pilus assembly protein TadB